MSSRAHPRTPWILALALVATVALAGCLGDGDEPASAEDGPAGPAGYASYSEAHSAAGEILEPVNGVSPVRLKVLQPADLSDVAEGPQRVVVLVFDSETDEPVTDATLRLRAEMPAMGHGTSGEEDPEHLGYGIYEGRTNFIMPGEWVLNLDARLADGTLLRYDAKAQVGGTGSGDGAVESDEEEPAEPEPVGPYESYEAAREAPGGVHEPVNSTSPVRLKLLEPEQPDNATTGRQNVTLLLFDNATDEPLTDAAIELKSFMPSMGHGTHPPEEDVDPEHTAHGVYAGRTNFIMTGDWVLYLDATLPDGTTLAFEVPVYVASESGGDGA